MTIARADYLKLSEVAKLTGMSTRTLWYYVTHKVIPGIRFGKTRWYIHKDQVQRLIEGDYDARGAWKAQYEVRKSQQNSEVRERN